jgi:hypothetical protein
MLIRLSVFGLALAAFAIGGCGGKAASNDDLVVSDNQALASPAPSSSTGGGAGGGDSADDDSADRGDDGCRDDDHDGHKNHHHHWFKVLDALDGTKDGKITIASLPAGTPDRLLARLHKLDTNNDGVVTRDEVKGHRHHRGNHNEQGSDKDSDGD